MSLTALVNALRAEARRTNERRLLVLHGGRRACYEGAREVLTTSEVDRKGTTLIGERDVLPAERVASKHTTTLLGTTTELLVFDAHDVCSPNALGRAVGTIDGGGLLVFLAPSLDEWPDRHDEFDASLAVFPSDATDASGAFRRRLVSLLRAHPGIAIVDGETHAIERDGLTHPAPRHPAPQLPSRSERDRSPGDDDDPKPANDGNGRFPAAVYERCLTDDQARCVRTFERLGDRSPAGAKVAVVAEADRGRGKSSAAGLAAGALAAGGEKVLVTAPSYRASAEIFARARDLLADFDCPVATDDEANPRELDVTGTGNTDGGSIRYVSPTAAADLVASDHDSDTGSDFDAGSDDDSDGPDVVFVDEAATLPVSVLDSLLAAERIAFTTTVHGYEGAGRGFAIRFRERLEESDHEVSDIRLTEPIRYAAGDPVEVWLFRALALDARPPVPGLVADVVLETARYERLSTADLLDDEQLLRESFGLLVAAHYRTEPNDLARLLDAPNLSVRALTYRGHVVSVCLLAREGALPADARREIYEGARIRGHMLPDLLTSQLRDERAGVGRGLRVVRIATHETVRSRGLGSFLLDRVCDELSRERREPEGRTDDGALGSADWLGVGYGATPSLIDFWQRNRFRTVHVSTTRNERSGEHSLVMLRALTGRGRDLVNRHTRWFVRRVPSVLSDALSGLDPDVARGALRSSQTSIDPHLSARDWRVVCAAAYGQGLYSTDPAPFRRLALSYFTDPALADSAFSDLSLEGNDRVLSAREERLLVCRVFQAHSPEEIATRLGYESKRQCLRALGDAYAALADRYGNEIARAERERYDG